MKISANIYFSLSEYSAALSSFSIAHFASGRGFAARTHALFLSSVVRICTWPVTVSPDCGRGEGF